MIFESVKMQKPLLLCYLLFSIVMMMVDGVAMWDAFLQKHSTNEILVTGMVTL